MLNIVEKVKAKGVEEAANLAAKEIVEILNTSSKEAAKRFLLEECELYIIKN